MVRDSKAFRVERCVFPSRLCVSLVGLVSALALSACGNLMSTPTDTPAQVVFATPLAEIVDGVRLSPLDNTWDGYGEAVDVRGDFLVIGAPEWNHFGPGSAYVYRFSGGEWREEAQLTASDRDVFIQQAERIEGQRFGSAVALGDGIVAIGAPGNTHSMAGEYSGAVYVFEHDGQTWVERAKLTPNHLEQDNVQTEMEWSDYSRMRPRSFGALVALDGDTLAVGGDSATNSVYVFQRGEDGWRAQARVPIPGSTGKDLYMASLALFGDTLALSAFYALPPPEPARVLTGDVIVYVFERAGDAWKESLRFIPEGAEMDFLFLREMNVGASVTLGGASGQANLLAIGLPGFPDWSGVQEHVGLSGVSPQQKPEFPESGHQTGAVYIFGRAEEGGWRRQATLRPTGWENPPGPGSLFSGVPSTTDGNQGAFDEAAYYASVVYPGHVFSEDPEISFFGATVDLDENLLAVTAGYANATYVFEHQRQDWAYRFRIVPRPEEPGLWEDFAQVVAISGDTLLLGTPGEFGNSAYVFDLCVQPSGICK